MASKNSVCLVMFLVVMYLKNVRRCKPCEQKKKRRNIEELSDVDAKLLALSDPNLPGYFSVSHKSLALDLEG